MLFSLYISILIINQLDCSSILAFSQIELYDQGTKFLPNESQELIKTWSVSSITDCAYSKYHLHIYYEYSNHFIPAPSLFRM